MIAISRGSGYFSTRGNDPVNMNLLFQLCFFLRKSDDLILYISWFCYFSEETVSFGIISEKIINKRTLEKRLIKVRSVSLKFNVHLGSWLLNHPFINFTLQAQWILASDRPRFFHMQQLNSLGKKNLSHNCITLGKHHKRKMNRFIKKNTETFCMWTTGIQNDFKNWLLF